MVGEGRLSNSDEVYAEIDCDSFPGERSSETANLKGEEGLGS